MGPLRAWVGCGCADAERRERGAWRWRFRRGRCVGAVLCHAVQRLAGGVLWMRLGGVFVTGVGCLPAQCAWWACVELLWLRQCITHLAERDAVWPADHRRSVAVMARRAGWCRR